MLLPTLWILGGLGILAGPMLIAFRWPHEEKPTVYLLLFAALAIVMGALSALMNLASPVLAAVVAAACGITSTSVALIVMSRERRLVSLLSELGSQQLRPQALRALHGYFVALQTDHRRRGLLVPHALRAADALAEAGYLTESVELLDGIDEARVPKAYRQVWHNNVAVYRLRSGDLAGARTALDAVEAGKVKRFQHVLKANRTLLLALEGAHREALDQLGTDPPEAPAKKTWFLARAHALAGVGDADGAREALRMLVRDEGVEVLRRANQPPGPATPIAASIAASADAPYR